MDTAEEVDDDGARSRVLGHLILGEHPVSQQDAEARARVGLQHVHDGLACGLNINRTERGEYAVVDCVVEEQHLCRLDEDGNQRQEAVVDQEVDACGQDCQNRSHQRSNCIVTDDRHDHTQNADREVVDQHLEACRHMTIHCLVKLLDDPACERAHQHRCHQHRLTDENAAVFTGGRNTGDTAHDCNRAHYASALSADHLAALSRDQRRDQEVKHERLNGCQLGIRPPASVNKQGRDKAPCDKRTDIRHDHAGQRFTDRLNFLFHFLDSSHFL